MLNLKGISNNFTILTDYGTRKKILALTLALILVLGTRVAT